jgi:hypothetical protein
VSDVTYTHGGRSARTVLAVALSTLLGAAVIATTASATAADSGSDHAVIGRFALTSEAGGAIWAFQPSGLLVLTGPGDIISHGTWSVGPGERDFDADIDYDIAGQTLSVKGQVAPDGQAIAVFVAATDARKPGDADPWPTESRLRGERLGMVGEPSPLPSATPVDCLRPQWMSAEVDWDRCDAPDGSQAPEASATTA